jgi:MOSC domain-containing protein YiiM
MDARLLAINIGSAEPIGTRKQKTGIFKHPVSGPVLIDTLGPLGDTIIDRKHHGGPDQAVYIYLQSDYDWWNAELGLPLPPGAFGENLTIDGVAGDTLSIGDRFTIGEVRLEVTMHRTPCNTFALKMGDPKWVKRFFAAGRPGAYARVLAPGSVEAGAKVDYRPFAGEQVRVSELLALELERVASFAMLERVLKTPVHAKLRAKFETLLAGR